MTNILDYKVGDRLLVSAMNRQTNTFDDDVFEVVITEFSPDNLYVKLAMFGVEGWMAYDRLKVRTQLDDVFLWHTGLVQ